MEDNDKKYNINLLGFGILFAVLACLGLLIARMICPTFSQIPAHIQAQYYDSAADSEQIRRAINHAGFIFIFFTIAGTGVALLVHRSTKKWLEKTDQAIS